MTTGKPIRGYLGSNFYDKIGDVYYEYPGDMLLSWEDMERLRVDLIRDFKWRGGLLFFQEQVFRHYGWYRDEY